MKQSSVGGLLWTGCVQQLALVEMMSLLRVLPLHTLVATVRQVVKQPPIVEGSQQVRVLSPVQCSIITKIYIQYDINKVSCCLPKVGVVCRMLYLFFF